MNNAELDNTLIITRRHKKDNEFIFSNQCVLSSVEKMFDGNACRSTMVGDMVLIGTTKYKCDSVGWSKI